MILNLSGIALGLVNLFLGFVMWPSWPVQNRETRAVMWLGRFAGVTGVSFNIAALVVRAL